MKIFFTIFIFTFFQLTYTFAQLRLGLSPSLAVPLGDFGSVSKNGYGGMLSAKFPISERFNLTSNFSFLAFGRQGGDVTLFLKGFGISANTANLINQVNAELQDPLEIPNVNFFPIEVGFEYNILKGKIRPYVGLSTGLYVQKSEEQSIKLYEFIFQLNQSLPPNQQIPNATIQNFDLLLGSTSFPLNGNLSSFGIAPTVGCVYEWSDKWSADLNIKSAFITVPERDGGAIVMTFNLGVFYKLGN